MYLHICVVSEYFVLSHVMQSYVRCLQCEIFTCGHKIDMSVLLSLRSENIIIFQVIHLSVHLIDSSTENKMF